MKIDVRLLAAGFAAACCWTGVVAGPAFWLDPSAKAEGCGTKARPFRSFAVAQAAVRAAVADRSAEKGEILVLVKAGRHAVGEPVSFCAADSGTAGRPVCWRAADEGGGVRLTGGRDLPALAPVDDATCARLPQAARAHVRTVDLRAVGIDPTLPDASVVWGDCFLDFARWPNAGYTGIAAVEDLGKDARGEPVKARGFTYADERVATWTDERDARAVGYFKYDWAAARVRIARIDPVRKTLEQAGDCAHYGYSERGYWYGENLLCEIDRPGEFHVGAETGRLTLWPPDRKGALPPQMTSTDTLLILRGVTNVTFRGFVFENTRTDALRAESCADLAVVGCRFLNVGRAASFVRSRRVRVAGCDATHCNAGGFTVRSCGDPSRLVGADVVVENCHISDFSRMNPTYTPAVHVNDCCGVTIRRNLIHQGPHVGILFSGRLVRIENNELHSVCLESGEMGAVYAGRDWTLCGDEIVGNYIHDIGVGSRGWNPNRGVMLDDGAAGVSVCSNRFVRVAEGISLSGMANRVERNLFIDNFPSVSGWQIWDEPACFRPSHYTMPLLLERFGALPVAEEPWKTRYPYLARIKAAMASDRPRGPELNTAICGNVIAGGPAEAFFYAVRTGAKAAFWTLSGNVRSKDGREAEAFLPPLASVGPHASPDRASWPVHSTVTAHVVGEMMKAQVQRYRPMPDND